MNRIITQFPGDSARPLKKARNGATNIIVDSDGTLTIQSYDGSTVPVVPSSQYAVNTVKVSIPSSGITSLNSTPLTIVPSSGAGTIIVPVNAFMYLHNQSASFSANTTVFLIHDTVSTPIYSGDVSDNVTVSGSMREFNKITTSANTTNLTSNQSLNLWAPFGSPVGGSATLDIWVTYKVVGL